MTDFRFLPQVNELITDIPDDSIVSRTILDEPPAKGVLFGFAPGQALSEHTASRPALLHFLAGEAQVTLGSDKMAAEAGTIIFMPANLPHSVVAITTVQMLLFLLK